MTLTSLEDNNGDDNPRMFTQPPGLNDDDITELAGGNRNRNGEAEREFNVKWQIKGGKDLSTIKRQLTRICTTLLIEFPSSITLIDQKQREWTFTESEDESNFQKDFETASFQVHPVKNKQRQVVRWISIVTFRSTSNIKDWKENDRFYATINEAETYVFPHPFGKDEWDIMSIGFLKEIHVVHYPKEILHETICELIMKDKPNTDIPKFQIIPQRITNNDKSATTKAYTVQCIKTDAKALSQLLTQGPFRRSPNQIFVPFRYKTTKPDVFLQCIRQQNEVYYKTWVIKLEGLQKTAMERIKPVLVSQPGVFQVVPTKNLDSTGEWKLMVDQSKCAYIHRTLTTMWPELVAMIPRKTLDSAPASYPHPRISSKKARDYQDSDADDDSYGSLLTTGTDTSQATLEDPSLNEPPELYPFSSYAEAVMGSAVSLDSAQVSSPSMSTQSEWQKEKLALEAQMKNQAELIEKIQADLQEKISRSHDLEEQLAQALDLAHNQGLIHRTWGDYEASLDKYQQALQVVVDQSTQWALQLHVADMYLALQEPQRALLLYQTLLAECQDPNPTTTGGGGGGADTSGMIGVLWHNIATIHVQLGDYELAEQEYRQALQWKEQSAGRDDHPELAKTWNSLGALYHGFLNESRQALECFRHVLWILRANSEYKDPREDPEIMTALQTISDIEQHLDRQKRTSS